MGLGGGLRRIPHVVAVVIVVLDVAIVVVIVFAAATHEVVAAANKFLAAISVLCEYVKGLDKKTSNFV